MDGPYAGREPHRANGHAHGPTAIALAAAEYARDGMALVKLPPRSKGEGGMRKGWNLRENAVTDPADVLNWHGNFGVLLAFSGLVSLDVDDEEQTAKRLAAHGVDYWAMKRGTENVGIVSRPNRFKLFFRVPDGVNPLSLKTHKIKDVNGNVILEFRCADAHGGSVQDVLPPSIHPNTGRPYEWHGEWRAIPLMPGWLLKLWQTFDNTTHARSAYDAARGDGSGADFLAVIAKLDELGCEPHMTSRGDARAHCPVHYGQSGTTLHITEKADGTVLLFCHAGCTQDAVMDAVGWGPGPEVHMGNGPRVEAQECAQEADTPGPAPDTLPPCPATLNALPGRMGEVQGWVESIMLRPHAGAAGLDTFALVDYLAMAQTRVDSRQGLAMGELFLILAPTAFGKESLRLPFRKLAECCARERIALPDLHYNAPASQQGLHEMLMASRNVCMLPDEFGDWVAKGEKDQCREQCMAYMMHVYGNPFGTVVVPNSVTRKYTPVEDPRLAMFCTSTTERFSEVINGSLADRGFLNRFVILPVGSAEMELNSDLDRPASAYEIPPALRVLAVDISRNKEPVTFDADAKAYRDAHYRAVLDPLARRDGRLAGRLHEQSLRMAAGLTLADGRHVVGVRDMAMAHEIREGLYARTVAMFDDAESLNANHPTVKALNQLRKAFARKRFIYRSQLGNHSRVYATLDVRAQESVVRALVVEGVVKAEGAKLVSLIFVDLVDGL